MKSKSATAAFLEGQFAPLAKSGTTKYLLLILLFIVENVPHPRRAALRWVCGWAFGRMVGYALLAVLIFFKKKFIFFLTNV